MKQIRVWIAVIFLMFVSACKCKDQKKINRWDFGKGASQVCPVFGAYPIFVKNLLPEIWKDPKGKEYKTGYAKALNEAIARWNKEAGKLGFTNFFELYDEALVKKYKPTKAPREWPILLYVQDAPKGEQKFGKSCELMRIGKSTFVDIKTMAWAEYRQVVRSGKPLWVGGRISFCIEKYEQGRRLLATPAAQKVRIMGAYGYFLHELGHALIGQGHLRMYGEIMRSAPENHAISHQMQELLRQRVVVPCQKVGAIKR